MPLPKGTPPNVAGSSKPPTSTMRGDTSFWNTILNALSGSKRATDITASGLRTINELGEAGVPGAESLMEWVDDKAYRLGSFHNDPVLDESRIDAVLERDLKYHPYSEGSYKGIESDKAPNLLRIFLGMDENTLPESEYKPSSWTKEEPEQGWRSVKEFSKFTTYPIEDDNSRVGKQQLEHIRDSSLGRRINSMRSAVSRGEYTPEMAVKTGDNESFPNVGYSSRVDMGHMTESIGYDKDRGQYYMSAADVWDFEPDQYAEIWGGADDGAEHRRKTYTQSSLMQASGKSVGLYDRYYLDDKHMEDWYGSLDEDMESKLMFAMGN